MLGIHYLLLLVYCFVGVLMENVKPSFRVLAPEFICPKDGDEFDRPDETVVMIQTQAGVNLNLEWTVKWVPLSNPTQRQTLLLWKAVRELQTVLNKRPKDPYVYVIENAELLKGVNYQITVTGTTQDGLSSDSKIFHIDNTQGNKDVNEVDGKGPQMSVVLFGGTKAVASTDYIVEAQITTCVATEDYHFEWTIKSIPLFHEIDVTKVKSAHLVIPANNLLSGITYEILCTVIMSSTGIFLAQSSTEIDVLRRGVELSMAADKLIVNINAPFTLEVAEYKRDNFEGNTTFDWSCKYNDEDCEGFVNFDSREITLNKGLPNLGRYEFIATAIMTDEMVTCKTYVEVIDAMIPTIQLTPIRRTLNQGSIVKLVANASNVAPSCNLTWYFQSDVEGEDAHGKPLSETLNIYSLEENFLNEITDYTNETEWRQITAELSATKGRARFVAECGCSLTFNCETQGLAYADISFNINHRPEPSYVSISPGTGTALDTVFRLNTLRVLDEDIPITYSFYSRIGDNDTLLLGTYSDHVSVETILPYIDGSTEIWVEACDSLGTCGTSSSFRVTVTKPDGSNVQQLLDSVNGNVRRCEMIVMRRNIVATIVSLKNADLSDILTSYIDTLSGILSGEDAKLCSEGNEKQYSEFLFTLATHGVDI